MDREACCPTVHGVAKSQTRLSEDTFSVFQNRTTPHLLLSHISNISIT